MDQGNIKQHLFIGGRKPARGRLREQGSSAGNGQTPSKLVKAMSKHLSIDS